MDERICLFNFIRFTSNLASMSVFYLLHQIKDNQKF